MSGFISKDYISVVIGNDDAKARLNEIKDEVDRNL